MGKYTDRLRKLLKNELPESEIEKWERSRKKLKVTYNKTILSNEWDKFINSNKNILTKNYMINLNPSGFKDK